MKKLIEIRTFEAGLVSSGSEADLPPSAASDMLNVDPHAKLGRLGGIPDETVVSTSLNFDNCVEVQEKDGTWSIVANVNGAGVTWYTGFYETGLASTQTVTGKADLGSDPHLQVWNTGVFCGRGYNEDPQWIGRGVEQFGVDDSANVYQEDMWLKNYSGFPGMDKAIHLPDGRVLAVKAGSDRIFEFDSAGVFVQESRELDPLVSIARDQGTSPTYVYVLKLKNGETFVERLLASDLSGAGEVEVRYTREINSEVSDIHVTATKVWVSMFKPAKLSNGGDMYDGFVDQSKMFFNFSKTTPFGDAYSVVDMDDRTITFETATAQTGKWYDNTSGNNIYCFLPRKPFCDLAGDTKHVGVMAFVDSTDSGSSSDTYVYGSSTYLGETHNTLFLVGETATAGAAFADISSDSAGAYSDLMKLGQLASQDVGMELISVLCNSESSASDLLVMTYIESDGWTTRGSYPPPTTSIGQITADSATVQSALTASGTGSYLFPKIFCGKYNTTVDVDLVYIRNDLTGETQTGTYTEATTTFDVEATADAPDVSMEATPIEKPIYDGNATTITLEKLKDSGALFENFVKTGMVVGAYYPSTNGDRLSDSATVLEVVSDTELTLSKHIIKTTDVIYKIFDSTSSFDTEKKYYWRWSFVYDGFQEGPLSKPITLAEQRNTNGLPLNIRIKIRGGISKRISAFKLYRADSEISDVKAETFFRLVEEVDLTKAIASGSDYHGTYTSFYLVDEGREGATYEAETSVRQEIGHMKIQFGISAMTNSQMLVGDCSVEDIDDARRYVFVSEPTKYSVYNWVDRFAILDGIPRGGMGLNGRFVVYDDTKAYAINPATMGIDDEINLGGATSRRACYRSATMGLLAGSDNIYMTDGRSFTPMDQAIRHLWTERDKTYSDMVAYNKKRNGFMVFFKDGDGNYRILFYSMNRKAWYLWESKNYTHVMVGKDAKVYAFGANLFDTMLDATSKKSFSWTSKHLHAGTESNDKKFYAVRVQKVGTGSDPTFTVNVDGTTQTLTADDDGNLYIRRFKSHWGQYMQVAISDVPGTMELDYLGYISRGKIVT